MLYSAVSKPDEVMNFQMSRSENSPSLLPPFLPLPDISAVCPSAQSHSSMPISFIYHEGDIHRFCNTTWLNFALSSYRTRSVQECVVFIIQSSCKNNRKGNFTRPMLPWKERNFGNYVENSYRYMRMQFQEILARLATNIDEVSAYI